MDFSDCEYVKYVIKKVKKNKKCFMILNLLERN
jgi:hypothetical protein